MHRCRLTALCLLLGLLTTALAEEGPKLAYPHTSGRLNFPVDEGRHSPTDWPLTLIEWYAHYLHLTAADGTRYLFFATFVTYDPIENLLGGKFPHLIGTLVDVTRGKTYHYRDLKPLKCFEAGHAETETAAGDYFRWRGADQPFCYDLRVGWQNEEGAVLVETGLQGLKPPLAVNGTGYIKLPKGDSGYYSQTRLQVTGTLTLNGAAQAVTGISWIDRQWLGMSCAANLGYTYEWWALQFDDHREAILFRLWETKTETVVMTHLDLLQADGTRQPIEDVVLTDLEQGWSVQSAVQGWDVQVLPACAGQGTWQSCDLSGTIAGRPVTGLGVAELARGIMREYMEVIHPAGGE